MTNAEPMGCMNPECDGERINGSCEGLVSISCTVCECHIESESRALAVQAWNSARRVQELEAQIAGIDAMLADGLADAKSFCDSIANDVTK